MGLKPLAQEACIVIRRGLIIFYFVDDIVLCFRSKDRGLAMEMIEQLTNRYTMKVVGEMRWFLGIHVIRDRANKRLWLSQEAYIEKVANQYLKHTEKKMPDTPMAQAPPRTQATDEQEVTPASRHLYQQKVGSILFAAITTRPDVAFAASRLGQANVSPTDEDHQAANRVIEYLHNTRSLAIQYGGSRANGQAFVCSSDASFADNPDRKSSQGFLMTLFGGPIAWKANKQATVTTSSTEAELLALSQTAREAMFLTRLFKAMELTLDEPLVIQCDNRMTIRLVTEEDVKLNTRLRHVDIHNHWLREAYKEKKISLTWIPTASMPADGLTKALSRQKHENFLKLTGLVDISEKLAAERQQRLEKDQSVASNEVEATVVLAAAKVKIRGHMGMIQTKNDSVASP